MADDAISPLAEQAALLDEWLEARRQIAVWEAKSADLLARRAELMASDVADAPLHRETIRRSMVAEYSAAGRMAKGSIEIAFTDADMLRTSFPALKASFDAGTVTAAHVREILRASHRVIQAVNESAVEPDTLRLFEAAALEFAETEAPSRTRAHVRELAAALAPQTVTERHKAARADQYVSTRPYDDELTFLVALLPTHQAVAIMDRLSRMSRHIKDSPEDRMPTFLEHAPEALPDGTNDSRAIFGVDDTYTIDPFLSGEPAAIGSWVPEAGPLDDPVVAAAYEDAMEDIIAAGPKPIEIPADTRGIDEVRADLLSDLLLSAAPSDVFGDGLENVTARIQVTVAASTLAGLDDNPAQLDGNGTLDPDVARALAGRNGGWTRLFLDTKGFVTRTDTYSPTAGMSRFLMARDQHCRFPGCRMPVHRCEIDHTHDYAKGGPTCITNLAHLCKSHHVLKHPDIPEEHRWNARQLPDWSLEWTSPLGRTYRDSPPLRVMFVPSEPSEPDSESASSSRATPVRWETLSGAVAPF
ncbi:hypothetical protein FM104_04555 [Microbacterium esteraromaticum]|uniref:HNH nuclease domain-containing protein n=1 Tax=Microbacterium esteraromaticum TaxID=57043 RepID=A0A1R4IZ94_9MICO|nr:HNH endonuclease signature motif containing protein [Microbacterium esteraromaticum]SJN24713.1 hypothetical protein FM104_04555 [Microbacterium esteraromaticum]